MTYKYTFEVLVCDKRVTGFMRVFGFDNFAGDDVKDTIVLQGVEQ